jgi:hypothetical protein
MQIYVHTKDRAGDDWTNGQYAAPQIPAVGEYIVAGTSSEWYLVTAVVHMLFRDAEYDAEVFAVLVSQVAATAKAGHLPD